MSEGRGGPASARAVPVAPVVKPTADQADAPGVTVVESGRLAGPARPDPAGHGALPATGHQSRRRPCSAWAEHGAVLGLLATAGGPLAHAQGGRDAGALAWYLLVLVAAAALTQPWRVLPVRWTVLGVAVSAPPLAVLVGTHGGQAAGVAAGTYAAAAATLLVVASYTRTPRRRAAVVAVVCAGGVAQFAWGLVPWWGGGDPSRPMVGSYDWHNQFAAALLAPALLGLALAVAGRRPWRAAGWVASPLAVAGIVLSTSRATVGVLIVGWLGVLAIALTGALRGGTGRRRVLTRSVLATMLGVVVTVALPGPPLFSTSVSPLTGTAARAAAGETLASNSTYRTEFWREAATVFAHHPALGAGFGRIGQQVAGHVPAGWAVSPLAHSGPVQAFADGGLLLGLPVLIALLAVTVGLLRRLRWSVGGRPAPPADGGPRQASSPGDEPARADRLLVGTAALAAVLAVLHAAVDTDWSYPALAAGLGVLAGMALGAARVAVPLAPPAETEGAARGRARGQLAAGALLGVLTAATLTAWGQPFHISAPGAVDRPLVGASGGAPGSQSPGSASVAQASRRGQL